MLWEKARRTLTEGKLELLFSELKLQDKEESTLKRMKVERSDKDGSFEAAVRKRFNGIVNKYGLSQYADDDVGTATGGLNKQEEEGRASRNLYFKDKRLNRLWEKAEKAGLSDEELMTLKLEFKHHQDKVEQYNALLEVRAALDKDDRRFNELNLNDDDEMDDDKEKKRHANELDGKAKEVKDNYDRLHRMATNMDAREFEDEKAQGETTRSRPFSTYIRSYTMQYLLLLLLLLPPIVVLVIVIYLFSAVVTIIFLLFLDTALWKLAQEADFSREELESLRRELHHFETRIHKMHYLEAEMRMADARRDPGEEADDGLIKEDTEGRRIMSKKMKRHAEEVHKIQGHLERTIAARHSEL